MYTICKHTYTYGHKHACTGIYIHICTQTRMYTNIHTHMDTHTHALTCLNTQGCAHTHVHLHTAACTAPPPHTWALACTCAHACIHTRAHTCAHVQKLFAPWVCWRARGRSPLAAALLPPEIPAGLAHVHPVRARVYGRACACTCAPITRVRACERAHHGTPALPPGRQRVPRVAHGLRRLGPLPERAARGPGAPAATPSPGRTSPAAWRILVRAPKKKGPCKNRE